MLFSALLLILFYFHSERLPDSKVKYIKELSLKENMKTITIPKKEYEELKRKAEVDEELLKDLIQGLKDVKDGNVIRVK
jgi:cell division protein FtsB